MPPVASFHLVRERPGRAAVALARLALDRPALRRRAGLRFWRLLGTGRGDDTGPSADLRRTALFAVWDSEAALDAFEAERSARWQAAEEAWHVRLVAAPGGHGHGTWRGVDPVASLPVASGDGPVAVITRADVRVRSWPAFRAASREVSEELRGHLGDPGGLLAVAAVGEAPVGRLGTFSLWRDEAAVRSFAHAMPRHVDAVRSTRRDDWYGEELFAWFRPVASRGSWDGHDPLAGLLG